MYIRKNKDQNLGDTKTTIDSGRRITCEQQTKVKPQEAPYRGSR
ncbi:hypothetical protein J2T20_002436 [Paenibacillus wynnii]|nr:hypothetical protein [Paenibacillus wynnii]